MYTYKTICKLFVTTSLCNLDVEKGDNFANNNYWPVSILHLLSNIFQKPLLLGSLKHKLDSSKFRKSRSTIDALVGLIDMVADGRESRNSIIEGVFSRLTKSILLR